MDALTYLQSRSSSCAFHDFLEMKITHLTVGKATIEMKPNPNTLNPGGAVHGGVLFSLCDIAAGTAALSTGRGCVTQNASISFVSYGPAEATLVATAEPLHVGNSTAVYHVAVTVKDTGKLVVDATVNMFFTHEKMPFTKVNA